MSSSSNSSSSSSLSSILEKSSSSSSLFDKKDYRYIPFTFKSDKNKKINSLAFYQNYVFAATSDNGMVIKSENRYSWENFYQTEDLLVTALFTYNEYLFVGTSPNSYIYKINMQTGEIKNYGKLSGDSIGFSKITTNNYDNIYLITSMPSNVYKYNSTLDKWEVFYKPYATEIYQAKTSNNTLYLACKGENIISFDGTSWKNMLNISTIKNTSNQLFSHVTYNFVDNSIINETKSRVNLDNIDNEIILDIFPQNRAIGVKSIEVDSVILLGASNKARLYSYDGTTTKVIFDTEGNKINYILNLESNINLISMDNKLYIANLSTKQYIPILILPNDEYISFMTKDDKMGIMFTTSTGRILSSEQSSLNAYLTGNRTVYANVWDGYGNGSNMATSDFFYALYKRITEITQDKEIVKTRFFTKQTSYLCDKITAEFVSQVMYVKQDMGVWKEIVWEEYKPENSDIKIYIRTATSSDELQKTPWKYCFKSEDGENSIITRKLNNIMISGQYLQMRVEMISYENNISPMLANVSIKYSTKKSFYFFTEKFALENGSDVKNGIMSASITKPINTEVNFGITDKNSADWNDYQTIDVDKLFPVSNYKDIKVGIKLVSYNESIPTVDEFALMFGDEKKQIIK